MIVVVVSASAAATADASHSSFACLLWETSLLRMEEIISFQCASGSFPLCAELRASRLWYLVVWAKSLSNIKISRVVGSSLSRLGKFVLLVIDIAWHES